MSIFTLKQVPFIFLLSRFLEFLLYDRPVTSNIQNNVTNRREKYMKRKLNKELRRLTDLGK